MNSFTLKSKDRPATVKSSAISNAIINANEPLNDHRAKRCCRLSGIRSSKRSLLRIPTGIYTLMALAIVTLKIKISTGNRISENGAVMVVAIKPIKINTKEFAQKPKSSKFFHVFFYFGRNLGSTIITHYNTRKNSRNHTRYLQFHRSNMNIMSYQISSNKSQMSHHNCEQNLYCFIIFDMFDDVRKSISKRYPSQIPPITININ